MDTVENILSASLIAQVQASLTAWPEPPSSSTWLDKAKDNLLIQDALCFYPDLRAEDVSKISLGNRKELLLFALFSLHCNIFQLEPQNLASGNQSPAYIVWGTPGSDTERVCRSIMAMAEEHAEWISIK